MTITIDEKRREERKYNLKLNFLEEQNTQVLPWGRIKFVKKIRIIL